VISTLLPMISLSEGVSYIVVCKANIRFVFCHSLATREALGAIAASSQAPAQRAPKRSSVLFPVRSSSSRRACSYFNYVYFLCFCLFFSTDFLPPGTPCTSYLGWNPSEYEPAHPGGSPRRVRSGLRPAPTQPLVS
jgi:hypothetical protein